MSTSRRKFINLLLGGGLLGWLGSIFYPVFSYLKPPPVPEANVNSVKAGPVADFPKNSGKIILNGGKIVIFVAYAVFYVLRHFFNIKLISYPPIKKIGI